ncbi:hypothetical protein ASPZODRAFT_35412, partial [Penicilliopsis zonata CBS 506.65]
GFYYIYLDLEAKDLTTFRTYYSIFKYKIISFRLINSPATFYIFIDCLDKFIIIYINNLLIYSKNKAKY